MQEVQGERLDYLVVHGRLPSNNANQHCPLRFASPLDRLVPVLEIHIIRDEAISFLFHFSLQLYKLQ